MKGVYCGRTGVIMNKGLMNAANMIAGEISYEDIVRWWQGQNIKTVYDLETVLENFNVMFAYNSSNIEDIPVSYHMTRELFCNGKLQNFTGDVSHVMELQNQKFAYEFMIKSLSERRAIDKQFVLKLHKIMMHGCYDERRWAKGERPGTFKVHDYCVGMSDVGAYPDEVEEQITELLDDVNSTEGDILTKAAYLHLVLENIHPFADGNGRVGRALMNYYLMLNNYPPTIIFNEDKPVYYMALDVFDRTENIIGFIKFVKEQTIKTWQKKIVVK